MGGKSGEKKNRGEKEEGGNRGKRLAKANPVSSWHRRSFFFVWPALSPVFSRGDKLTWPSIVE
ncbi:MAG: hypothetical protein RH982_01165, partial [Parvibaculum sp.]